MFLLETMNVIAWVVIFLSMVSSLKSLSSAAIWANTPGDMFDGMVTPPVWFCPYEQQCPISLSKVTRCFVVVRCLIVIPNDTCFGSLTLVLLAVCMMANH